MHFDFSPVRRALLAALVCGLPSAVGCGDGAPGSSDELTLPQKIDIAEREIDPEVRARKLLALSAEQRQIKDLPGGTHTTEKAQEAAGAVTDPAIRARLLVAVADEFTVLGRTEESREAAGDAQLSAVSIADRNAQLEVEAKIVVAFSRSGDGEKAKTALESLETKVKDVDDPAERASLAALLSATAATAGNGTVAEKYAAEVDAYAAKITDVPSRIKALAVAAGRLYRGEQPAEGRKRLDAAVVLARGLTDPAVKADAFLGIFETLQDLRKAVPLAELLPEAKTAAAAVADEKARNALTARVQTLLNLPE